MCIRDRYMGITQKIRRESITHQMQKNLEFAKKYAGHAHFYWYCLAGMTGITIGSHMLRDMRYKAKTDKFPKKEIDYTKGWKRSEVGGEPMTINPEEKIILKFLSNHRGQFL
eukprot:TRINITY_DN9581_c0_g1_i7.p1 TRINITY_DN9581_c0_g1~~TRINITY_DN9581_c0_g1_i7.p1  ORF type:complete len:112 (+),score=20.42 TRINITY_DN9581_c0_g1_i7:64-399(+)